MSSATAAQLPPRLSSGDIAPSYVGITGSGKLYTLEAQAGRAVALLLVGALDLPRSRDLIAAFEKRAEAFKGLQADIVVLTLDNPEQALTYAFQYRCLLTIATEAAEFMIRCGLSDSNPTVIALDRNSRVVDVHPVGDDSASILDAVLTELGALPTEEPRQMIQQAPVLLIPNVAGVAFCRRLIDLFEKGGHFDSGFMTVDNVGKPVLKIDHGFKRRSDHFVQPGHPLHDELLDILVTRIAPEVKKAFQVDIAHCERFLIARYDQSGGYFRRHRDTAGAANAYRQFAITLNLNTEDYEGGHLVFPEYGPHLYRPPAGGAVIFSGSLLHEALPVTKGTRYALLGFLHNAEAEMRHQRYLEGVDADSARQPTAAAAG